MVKSGTPLHLLHEILEWIELHLTPEEVFFDDIPLHDWARENGYVKRSDEENDNE